MWIFHYTCLQLQLVHFISDWLHVWNNCRQERNWLSDSESHSPESATAATFFIIFYILCFHKSLKTQSHPPPCNLWTDRGLRLTPGHFIRTCDCCRDATAVLLVAGRPVRHLTVYHSLTQSKFPFSHRQTFSGVFGIHKTWPSTWDFIYKQVLREGKVNTHTCQITDSAFAFLSCMCLGTQTEMKTASDLLFLEVKFKIMIKKGFDVLRKKPTLLLTNCCTEMRESESISIEVLRNHITFA